MNELLAPVRRSWAAKLKLSSMTSLAHYSPSSMSKAIFQRNTMTNMASPKTRTRRGKQCYEKRGTVTKVNSGPRPCRTSIRRSSEPRWKRPWRRKRNRSKPKIATALSSYWRRTHVGIYDRVVLWSAHLSKQQSQRFAQRRFRVVSSGLQRLMCAHGLRALRPYFQLDSTLVVVVVVVVRAVVSLPDCCCCCCCCCCSCCENVFTW